KLKNPDALAELPSGKHGRGRLNIHPSDLDAATQLVDGILRDATPRASERFPGRVGSGSNAGRIRKELVAPAVGLLLTAVAAFAWTVGPAGVAFDKLNHDGDGVTNRFVFAGLTVLGVCGVPLVFAGAAQMLRRRSYPLCVAAAIVAMLPWSPAWLAGLPVGIWALRVLSRREVILDFLGQPDGQVPAPPVAPKPTE